ncbi:MAG: 4-hydroxy-tetrahydrodipicolinate reductase [Methanomassiliicoccaceae archaeon]|jgi:4-hydroxy-tetrahydrodipicolinate reductase|nr:4-hydroxy-tetrahydrodipicolinate reductase [Methanomassiliicoccaceae archaeon]
MMNIALGGATGRMGRTICDMMQNYKDMRLVGAMIDPSEDAFGKEIYPGVIAKGPDDLKGVVENADVYVDITTAAAASKIIDKIPKMGTNMVIGTTAIPEEAIQRMRDAISKNGTSAVLSANYAVGVNVFWKACEMLAASLKGYDIEVIEVHHNKKIDSPSGTAMEAVKRMRKAVDVDNVIFGREGITGARKKEICVHSVRCGDVVGDHTVIFAGDTEVMELRHRAGSREALAKGFIEAIRWIYGKKDGKIHDMNEVLGL